MKKLYIVLTVLLWMSMPQKMRAQNKPAFKVCSCAMLMKKVSKGWKADSLAGNGYRISVYNKLLNCEFKNVSQAYLLKALGQPKKIRKNFDGRLDFIYRYYDYKYIDTTVNKWKGYGWSNIVFTTDQSGQKIVEVSTGSGEY